MNYVRTSGRPVSFSGIFKEIAQMYEQNVNDPNNSVLTYEVITFQPSHNHRVLSLSCLSLCSFPGYFQSALELRRAIEVSVPAQSNFILLVLGKLLSLGL